MNRLYFLMIFLFTTGYSFSQVVTTNPSLPFDNQSVVVTFDASQGDKGLMNYTGTVYAHTGVITDKSTSGSDWKYVKAAWAVNKDSCKLTKISANQYQLTLSPSIRQYYNVPSSEKILKMAFVFRSSDGTVTGRDVGGADIFTNVYQEGLNVNFVNPSGRFSFVTAGQSIPVQINATANDSIYLYLDNNLIKSITGQSLTDTITASDAAKHTLIAKAIKGSSAVYDTTYFIVPGSTPSATLPSGVKDGINYIDNQTITFVLFAPYKSRVYLLGDFNDWIPDNNYLMKKDGDHFWFTLSGLTSGKEYIFQYLIDDSIRIADPYCDKISDPNNDSYIPDRIYPGLIKYPTGKTTEIAGVVQTGQAPYSWQVTNFTAPPKNKLTVYELLIRDFTANKDIKTVKDTLSYLKRLGVNAIELMPFNEFEGNDSWGYNPSFYFAPDKAYGTKNDYKQFIDECHKQGIAVIQDLVLNHSYGSSPLVRMYFANGKPTSQNPWYNVTSNIQNTSLQFGYDFNHDSPYTRKLVDSIASYWMSEYKIDGFRYDFTKGFSNTPYANRSDSDFWASSFDMARIYNLKRMSSEVWKRKPNAYMIFEHLTNNTEETTLANYGDLLWCNLNTAYNEATMGYISGSNFSDISYQNKNWKYPNLMGYMESHDEERLMYKNETYGNSSGTYNIKDTTIALQRMELASTFFYTVPGPKMLWEFGELGYDISRDQGGRLSDKAPKWEYYANTNRKHLYDITAALIKLRLQEPVFSTTNILLNLGGSIKTITLNLKDSSVFIMGNFDVNSQDYTAPFPSVGTWHEFFTGNTLNLTSTSTPLTLKPGEYRMYSNVKLQGTPPAPLTGTVVLTNDNSTSFRIYPNPFSSQINIESQESIQGIDICTIHGRIIKKVKETDISCINTSEIQPGFYLLVANLKNGGKIVKKIVKY